VLAWRIEQDIAFHNIDVALGTIFSFSCWPKEQPDAVVHFANNAPHLTHEEQWTKRYTINSLTSAAVTTFVIAVLDDARTCQKHVTVLHLGNRRACTVTVRAAAKFRKDIWT
jgi:hypothetical protein